jgi:hypothetical protein
VIGGGTEFPLSPTEAVILSRDDICDDEGCRIVVRSSSLVDHIGADGIIEVTALPGGTFTAESSMSVIPSVPLTPGTVTAHVGWRDSDVVTVEVERAAAFDRWPNPVAVLEVSPAGGFSVGRASWSEAPVELRLTLICDEQKCVGQADMRGLVKQASALDRLQVTGVVFHPHLSGASPLEMRLSVDT